jgi:hypothetical protein
MRQQMVGLALSLAVLPGTAGAEGIQGEWSVSLSCGTDLELAGDLHTGGAGSVLGLPTAVEDRGYSDIYDRSFRGQVSVGYGVTRNLEIFGRGSYYKMSSGNVVVGDVASLDLFGRWRDYREWGFEAGPRLYFSPESAFKPYAAVTAGVRFLRSNPATFSVPAANVVLNDVPFFDETTVGVFGADLGFTYDVAPGVGVGVETGPRYQTKPSRLNGLAGTGLDRINDTASRWSMPIVGTVSFRF